MPTTAFAVTADAVDTATNTVPPAAADRPLPRAALLLAALLLAGVFVGAVTLLLRLAQPGRPRGPDLAEGAKRLVERAGHAPLSEPLRNILETRRLWREPSQPHPLVGKPAPRFTLPGVDGKPVALDDLLKKGPVVVVFYYGYYCDHCVAQLFALERDRRYFEELGVTLLALSPDPSAETAAKYKEYAGKGGAFGFPVLADAGNKTATRYGTFRPQAAEKPELHLHGTFVIDKGGTVRWAATGPNPYTNNRGLLCEAAAAAGKLPDGRGERGASAP